MSRIATRKEKSFLTGWRWTPWVVRERVEAGRWKRSSKYGFILAWPGPYKGSSSLGIYPRHIAHFTYIVAMVNDWPHIARRVILCLTRVLCENTYKRAILHVMEYLNVSTYGTWNNLPYFVSRFLYHCTLCYWFIYSQVCTVTFVSLSMPKSIDP